MVICFNLAGQMTSLVLVFLGGGAGSLLRYVLGLLFGSTRLNLPLATLSANVLACLIYALILGYSSPKTGLNDNIKHLVLIGFCGGLSTFSTFSAETFLLLKQGLHFYAFGNILLSFLMCVGLFFWFSK